MFEPAQNVTTIIFLSKALLYICLLLLKLPILDVLSWGKSRCPSKKFYKIDFNNNRFSRLNTKTFYIL